MTWREPRPDEAFPVTCESVRELAEAYHPFVRWSTSERFFPVLAEAWLSHATSAPWPRTRIDRLPRPPMDPETGVDPHRRGTGVCSADVDVRRVQVHGGVPNPDDRPLSLDPGGAGGDPDSLASYTDVDGSFFLDVGGWIEDLTSGPLGGFQGRRGDLEYLHRAFSELSAALQPGAPWEPVELMAHLPQLWVPQPPTPTVYCEARWAGDDVAVSERLDEPDFPPLPDGALDDILVLTYHYLYPAREPSEGEPDVRAKEGQWTAVSVYFQGKGAGTGEAVFLEPPLAVVASQGNDGTGVPTAELRRWDELGASAAHPILFASLGTHRFFFEPTDGQPFDPGTGAPPAPDGGSFDQNDEFPGWESWLVGGLLIAGFIALFNPLAGLIVAIVVILFWLFTLIMDLCNDTSENPANPNPGNPAAGGEGPQSGDPEEPPAPGPGGGGSGAPGDGGGQFGLPNAGSPTGKNTSSFDVRVIDRATADHDRSPTGYPSDRPCEQPTWWDYSGRWGVRVAPGLATDWASGDRRVDEHGRSVGYWHTLRFFEALLLAAG